MHWFSGSCKEFDNLESATGLGVALISEVVNHSPDVRLSGLNGYTTTYRWNGGLKLMVNTKVPELGIFLLAKGKACEFYGFDTLAFIGQTLRITSTRVDLAVDGFPVTPLELHECVLDDLIRTQARPMKGALEGREKQRAHTLTTSPTGDTLHLGSKTATQSARCYNSRGFTRFEMMLRGERAAQVMRKLYDGAELGPTLGAAIDQFVAFVELDDRNRSRCSPLPFWARFMARLGRNEVVTRLEARPEPTRESLRLWLKDSVSPSLAAHAAIESWDGDTLAVLKELLQEGEGRFKSKHYALIAACKVQRVAADDRPEIVRDTLPQSPELDDTDEKDAA